MTQSESEIPEPRPGPVQSKLKAKAERAGPSIAWFRSLDWHIPMLAAILVFLGLLLCGVSTAQMHGQVILLMGLAVIGFYLHLVRLPNAARLIPATVIILFVLLFSGSGSSALLDVVAKACLASIGVFVALACSQAALGGLIHRRRCVPDKEAAIAAQDARSHWLANHDTLTKLPNRQSFLVEIEAFSRDLDRSVNQLFIGVLDLDDFRVINSAFGHRGGDQVLMEVARRLRDVAGDTFRVYRLAGDRFGLVGACAFCERAIMLERSEAICTALEVPYALKGVTARITATIGLASSATVSGGAQRIHEAAEYALLNAKQNLRRGHANLFSLDQRDSIRRHSLVEQELQTANLEAELTLVFQPIVAAATGAPVGFEALARWENHQLGHVSPAEFIQIGEQAGLANRLTCVLLSKALAIAATWPTHLRLSFNLSTQDICSSENMLRLIAILHGSPFDPKRIDFEITETADVVDFDQLIAAVTTLKAFGSGISLDDFGTGYATLWQVHRLPLDKLKIDRSFVKDITTSSTGYKIVKAVVALCRDMKISCVIEGVETEGELETLRSLDCELVQGYLFSKPLPVEKITDYIESAGVEASSVAPDMRFGPPALRASGAMKTERPPVT